MKIEDAIKFFKSTFVDMAEWGSRAVKGSATQRNILANMQYLEMAIEALEKQIPKTAPNVRENGLANILFGDCPICKSAVYTDEKYCGQCGQALKWGGAE